MINKPDCSDHLLLLLAAPLQAQEAQAPAEPTIQTSTSAAATRRGCAGACRAQPQSPFDYRSSEEISEDLSVSFPVDI